MLTGLHDTLDASSVGYKPTGPSKPLVVETRSPSDKAYRITQFLLNIMHKDSPFFQKNPSVGLPRFNANEVSMDENLGQGECGTVFSIGAIQATSDLDRVLTKALALTEETSAPHDDETKTEDDSVLSLHECPNSPSIDKLSVSIQMDDDDLTNKAAITSFSLKYEVVDDSKDYMRTHVVRDGRLRYAVKILRKDLKGNRLVQATADLAAEASFLRSLRGHPNICKIQGTIGEPGKRNFGIVMDRFIMNLREKMRDWKKYDERRYRLLKKIVLHHQQPSLEEQLEVQKQIYGEKLMAVNDIARALRHLADNRIIFRDLKPENVGVDARGDMRLCDFGSAKELKDKDMTTDGMYKLTGMTGSRRYMAPEVIQSKDYGLSADVYSFAILAWEVISNCTAYSFITSERLFDMVVRKKMRPDLKKLTAKKKQVVPQGSHICDLVSLCWCQDSKDRLTIEQVCDLIQAEMDLFSAGLDESSSTIPSM